MKISTVRPSSATVYGRLSIATAKLQILLVGAIVASSLYVTAAASWTTLFSDQWRIYDTYFRLPFPQDLLVSQNGHHPVLPGLLFLADIHLAGANNYLINTVGILLAVSFCVWWSATVKRDPELDEAMKLATVGLLWLAVFWLGNLRVLVHGNESLHVYPILLTVALVAVTLHRRGQARGEPEARHVIGPTLIVIVAGVLATFTFGFGVLVLVVAALLAWMANRDLREATVLGAISVLNLAIYGLTLPGKTAGLRGPAFDPADIVVDASTWLGAPVVRAVEGFPASPDRPDLLVLAALVGGAGLLAVVILSLRRLLARRISSQLEAMATAIVLFGAGCSFLVAVARGTYFDQFPGQVVGPRYLPWSSAFWAALLVLVGLEIRRQESPSRWLRASWLSLATLLPLLLLPSHEGRNFEYKKNRSLEAALGLVVGARDDATVKDHLFQHPPVVYRVAEILHQRRWGVFSHAVAAYPGRRLADLFSYRQVASPRVASRPRIRTVPTAGGAIGAHVSASVDESLARDLDGRLLITDESGVVVGVGHVWAGNHRVARRLGLLAPTPPSYSGYFRPYSADRRYEIHGVRADGGEPVAIGWIGPGAAGPREAQTEKPGAPADNG